MIRKYFTIFQLTWQEYLIYRLNFALEIVGGVFLTTITTLVWKILFDSQSQNFIENFSQNEMVTYILGGGVIASFLLLTAQGDDINDDINEGKLSHLLLKPMNPNIYWFVRDICRKYFTFLIGIFGFIVVVFLFKNYILLPAHFLSFVLFLLSLIVAMLIHFVLFYVFSIVAFWFDRTWGMRFFIRVLMELASGALIPITFFPSAVAHIFNFLPFKFFAFVPMEIYLGKITTIQTLFELLQGIIWLVVLSTIAFLIWKKGIKHYTALGS